ncbi:MAG: hypothetical protein V7K96_32550, partial [Nostoc sp.]
MTESDNRAAPRQLTLFEVESVATAPPLPSDSYWDEITNGDSDRWNPADFGEAPHLSDNGQLTIFYDESLEPP